MFEWMNVNEGTYPNVLGSADKHNQALMIVCVVVSDDVCVIRKHFYGVRI